MIWEVSQPVKCARCGYVDWTPSTHRYWYRTQIKICASCRAQKASKIVTQTGTCIPWHGDFDDNDNPMQNGRYYMPGIRTCNHRDCVAADHIISDPDA